MSVRVPANVYEGLFSLRTHAELDPEQDLIECMQYLSRYESMWPAEQWIVDNPLEFWKGWDEGFLKEHYATPKAVGA